MNDICSLYDINYSEIVSFLEENSIKKVLIQAPDGLKKLVRCILEKAIDNRKHLVYISNSPTYGGCDLAIDEAIKLSADAVIHIGHNKYPHLAFSTNIPILYVPAYFSWRPGIELVDIIVETLNRDRVSSIGLVSTIQHVHSINELSQLLGGKGFSTYIGNPRSPGMEKGQVIGCDYSAIQSIDNEVDAYIVVAGGRFHAIGVALITNKRVYGLDPYSNIVWNAQDYVWKILVKRHYLLAKLRNNGFKSTGLIIGIKPGQYRQHVIEQVAKLSEENSIEYHYIVTNDLNIERLLALDNALALDSYVVTSCPRLPIDDLGEFYKPVLTPGEFFMIFKRNSNVYIYPW